jgi:hypothetical protein
MKKTSTLETVATPVQIAVGPTTLETTAGAAGPHRDRPD